MTSKPKNIAVENVNVPGKLSNVNAAEYEAMKEAFLRRLPATSPGLRQKEIQQQVNAHLPQDLFHEDATSAWWARMLQLDLEAKGVVIREQSKPLRWHKT